jgi:hypothetical protein
MPVKIINEFKGHSHSGVMAALLTAGKEGEGELVTWAYV